MPVVQHPDQPNIAKEVPAEQVKEWTAAGWKQVKKDDEQSVLDAAARAQRL